MKLLGIKHLNPRVRSGTGHVERLAILLPVFSSLAFLLLPPTSAPAMPCKITLEKVRGALMLAQSEARLKRRIEATPVDFRELQIVDARSFQIREDHLFNYQKTMPDPFVSPKDQEAANGAPVFVNSGVNTTNRLREIKTINGCSLAGLSEWAKGTDSTTGSPRRSEAGFINHDQDLRNVLINDNITVVDRMHLSHQIVAFPLLLALKAHEAQVARSTLADASSKTMSEPSAKVATAFNFRGNEYVIEADIMGGTNQYTSNRNRSGWIPEKDTQGSFFGDELFANYTFVITRKDGKRLAGDALTPHMIYRYGFYQGGEYRLDPMSIIDFFRLDKPLALLPPPSPAH